MEQFQTMTPRACRSSCGTARGRSRPARCSSCAMWPACRSSFTMSPECPTCTGARALTVGSVIATKEVIVPAAVGVDIGCGDDGGAHHAHGRPTCPTACRRSVPRSSGRCPRAWNRAPARTTTRVAGRSRPTRLRGRGSTSSKRAGGRSSPSIRRSTARPPTSSGRWAAATTSSSSVSTRRTGCGAMLHSGSRGHRQPYRRLLHRRGRRR